jgi:hypothetical protein
MKRQTSYQCFFRIKLLLGFAALLGSTARAADVAHWDNLKEKIGHGREGFGLRLDECCREDRIYTVVTTSGEKFHFTAMAVDRTHVWGDGPDIPVERIAEIRIRHKGRFADPVTQSLLGGLFVCAVLGHACAPLGVVVIPVAVGFGAVITVPLIAAEGIWRLKPAKVIKVVP